jgi:nucleoside 2-deoxyribosyltransferase
VAEIITGDKFDIRNSDVVIANCWQPSWGTAMEIHYAHEIGVPVIVVLPADARVSPWLTYHAEMIVHDIKQAVDKIGS